NLKYTTFHRPPGAQLPDVLLFPDSFVNYFEPDVGLAVLALLDRVGSPLYAGFPEPRHLLPPFDKALASGLRGCGRPLLSNGMLAQAVDCARHNVQRLYRWAEITERPIVACEPSCILTIKDDYPALLRGEWRHKAERVAAACQTFEE